MPSASSAALRPVRLAALALALALAPAAAAAAGPEICERAVADAATRSGVPPAILHAIALTETGRWQDGRLRPWPWAVNREGQGHWFGTREEALAFARRSLGEGRPSFDMGCFQINYRWHGDSFSSLASMAEPATGALYAAHFLRDLHAELGSWSAAAGAYHSRTPALAERYRARFDRILAALDGRALSNVLPPEPQISENGGRRITAPRIISVVRTDGDGFVAERAPTEAGELRRVITVGPEYPPPGGDEPASALAAGRSFRDI